MAQVFKHQLCQGRHDAAGACSAYAGREGRTHRQPIFRSEYRHFGKGDATTPAAPRPIAVGRGRDGAQSSKLENAEIVVIPRICCANAIPTPLWEPYVWSTHLPVGVREWRTTMTASSYRQSAKIYQFPEGGRAALGGRRDEAQAAENFAASRFAKVACGGAWYHQEAIEKAERVRKA
jgi:hypothetical protein